jgi:hypothetical protein
LIIGKVVTVLKGYPLVIEMNLGACNPPKLLLLQLLQKQQSNKLHAKKIIT